MKNAHHNRSEFDQNWRWPEKTWFQERLKAVKARERETQQKHEDSPQECAEPTPSQAGKSTEQP